MERSNNTLLEPQSWQARGPPGTSGARPAPHTRAGRTGRTPPRTRDDGDYYWQPYVNRIIQRLDGLPAPNGGESFVRACLATGCKAVPVMQTSTLWQRGLEPQELYRAESSGLAARVRLGLFLAASLRYLVHGLCRLRIKAERGDDWHPLKGPLRKGEIFWHPVRGGGVSFRVFRAAHEGRLGITWLDVQPTGA